MPFAGISFSVVCAKISALQSISVSMNLGVNCCTVTETSKSPHYNTHFSSPHSAHINSPHPQAAQAENGWDKNQPRERRAEGGQGRGYVSL